MSWRFYGLSQAGKDSLAVQTSKSVIDAATENGPRDAHIDRGNVAASIAYMVSVPRGGPIVSRW
jgi:hypothetical protein